MKRQLVVTAVIMVLVMTLSACGGSGTPGNTESTPAPTQAAEPAAEAPAPDTNEVAATPDETPYTITIAYIGGEQPNQTNVLQAVNDLTLENINMNIEFIQLGFGDYADRLRLMLSGGDRLDVLPIFYTEASSYINAGQIVNLADYIDEHGKDIISFMGADVAKSGAVKGFIYGTPANKESASKAGIVMRKDIVDELNIDVNAISKYDDLTPIFEQVKAA
jgi:putative aldouronate transport system substrate-binding protein